MTSYESYCAYCERLEIPPLSEERWALETYGAFVSMPGKWPRGIRESVPDMKRPFAAPSRIAAERRARTEWARVQKKRENDLRRWLAVANAT